MFESNQSGMHQYFLLSYGSKQKITLSMTFKNYSITSIITMNE